MRVAPRSADADVSEGVGAGAGAGAGATRAGGSGGPGTRSGSHSRSRSHSGALPTVPEEAKGSDGSARAVGEAALATGHRSPGESGDGGRAAVTAAVGTGAGDGGGSASVPLATDVYSYARHPLVPTLDTSKIKQGPGGGDGAGAGASAGAGAGGGSGVEGDQSPAASQPSNRSLVRSHSSFHVSALVSPRDGCYGRYRALVLSSWFDAAVTAFILLNVVFLSLDYHNKPDDLATVLAWAEGVFVSVFLLEMILKIVAFGGVRRYLRSPVNVFDAVIVLVTSVDFFLSRTIGRASYEQYASSLNVSALRAFRIVRLLLKVERLRQLLLVRSQTRLSPTSCTSHPPTPHSLCRPSSAPSKPCSTW